MAHLFKINGSDDWHAKIKLGPYRQKRARFCTDKDTSGRLHTLLQAAVDRAAAGEPPRAETVGLLPERLLVAFGLASSPTAQKRRGSYAENVADYKRELETAGRDPKYVRNVNMYLTAVGNACGWKRLTDIGRDSFVKYLARRKADGTAPRTLKNLRATVMAFCLWAVGAERLDRNPLARLPSIDTTADRRRLRRALTPDEVTRLLAVAGPRELVYRVALGTGLRLSELRRLQWGDVRIDDTFKPRMDLRPEATKSKRADSVPFTPSLVARLRKARPDDYSPTDPVFRTVPEFDTWCADMDRAGITYRDGDVLTVGFHSLRVTFCSELERAGVTPRTIMELMRHRDYKLTAGTYTDRRVLDTFGAVGKLPDYETNPAENAQTARRTGTDDLPVRSVGQDQIQDQTAAPSVHFGSSDNNGVISTIGRETPRSAAETPIPQGNLGCTEHPGIGSSPTRGDRICTTPPEVPAGFHFAPAPAGPSRSRSPSSGRPPRSGGRRRTGPFAEPPRPDSPGSPPGR